MMEVEVGACVHDVLLLLQCGVVLLRVVLL
jgi:hypothetical protein